MAFNLGDALKSVSELDTGREQIEYIRLDRIDNDPNNFYQLSDIDNLAANIELCGLQQPIRLRPNPENPERYMIVSGHRRRAAIELLAKDNPEKWAEVACIIERDAASPALQQLRLIYANSNTRTMTAAEISEQAVQVEKLLYQLKEEGYEFPGRMRDHVAEAVGASKSKLARLKVIRDRLESCWWASWEANKIGESVAYALAQLPGYWQTLIFNGCSNPQHLYESSVQEYAKRFEAISRTRCGETKAVMCRHQTVMMEKSCKDCWQDPCKSRCCWDCPSLRTCKDSCKAAEGRKKDLRDEHKAEAAAQAQQAADRDRPKVQLVDALWQRFGLARELAGKDWAQCKAVMGCTYFPLDDEKVMHLECGEAKVTPDTRLPYWIARYDVEKLLAVADLLECSLDWLLCRTDVKEMATETVPESDRDENEPAFIMGAWYPATVEPPVGISLIGIDSMGYADTCKYKGCGEYTMDYGDPVVLWTLMPEEKDAKQTAPAVSGWQSGTPEAYGTYAAYVKVTGAANPMLRELLWDGQEWFLFGQKISEDVTVQCWTDRPEL